MVLSGWDALAAELDAWGEAGAIAGLWWRDDDAADTGPALERLLTLAGGFGAPLCLAVIPAHATPALAAALQDNTTVAVAQHGWRHANHEAEGARKAEFGAARAPAAALTDLDRGRAALAGLFGPQARPLLVPPWNRLAPSLLPALPGLGFRAVSAFGRGADGPLVPGLLRLDTHVDPIDWRGNRGFLGEAATLATLCGHLAARRGRLGAAAAAATGLLTHHLVTDTGGWTFLERLLRATCGHGAARWLHLDQALGTVEAAS